ncbi:MAG: CpaF family protein [Candidatus Wallbacteria bacterium]|nr:CpaF family protein [Candidatus Wallbacteria bacterium]
MKYHDDGELERKLCEQVRAHLRTRVPARGLWSADEVGPVVEEALERMAPDHPRREALRGHALEELVGLGPLDELLAAADVSEILVNGTSEIYVEIGGRLLRHERSFRDSGHLQAVLERLLASSGRSISEKQPWAEGMLADGSRFHLTVPPMAPRGPILTIRRFPVRWLTVEALTNDCGAMPTWLAELLQLAVQARTAILFTGAAGVGKTTLLNALAEAIPHEERVLTLETTAELRLDRPNWSSLECVRPAPDGTGGADLGALLRNALRMRPDRILVGECLSAEAFDLLQLMNTGHGGCMTTLHANSPRDALERLFTLCAASRVAVPAESLWRQIAASIGLIVHLERFAGGARRVAQVAAVHRTAGGGPEVRELARLENAAEPAGRPPRWSCSAGLGDLPPHWSRAVLEHAGRLLKLGGAARTSELDG